MRVLRGNDLRLSPQVLETVGQARSQDPILGARPGDLPARGLPDESGEIDHASALEDLGAVRQLQEDRVPFAPAKEHPLPRAKRLPPGHIPSCEASPREG